MRGNIKCRRLGANDNVAKIRGRIKGGGGGVQYQAQETVWGKEMK